MSEPNWLNTRAGQELAATFKSISHSLRAIVEQDMAERSSLVTTNVFFKQKVADRAWDLFKQEVETCELITPFGEVNAVTEVRLKHYIRESFRLATLFTALEDGGK